MAQNIEKDKNLYKISMLVTDTLFVHGKSVAVTDEGIHDRQDNKDILANYEYQRKSKS